MPASSGAWASLRLDRTARALSFLRSYNVAQEAAVSASRVPTQKDWVVNIIVVGLAAAGLVVAGLFLGRTHPLVFLGAALVVLFLLVRWNAGATAYICQSCGREFTLTPVQDFLSPHTFDSKYSRCPHCGQRSWNRTRVRE